MATADVATIPGRHPLAKSPFEVPLGIGSFFEQFWMTGSIVPA
ncbi:hypothetical protein ABI_18890 [Asticcacaulis biprosthecium C19]|uniref:Uncharacterized protein n=1 Tax=Asticcacaulis biprosthecium C19 TaxID=715226 RepID=F4QL73_9CAUL|nr:hypothetical protein ABI_18890 [Asticcacaulis biprosthecium C19]